MAETPTFTPKEGGFRILRELRNGDMVPVAIRDTKEEAEKVAERYAFVTWIIDLKTGEIL